MINAVQSAPLAWGISLQASNQTTSKTESDNVLFTALKAIAVFLRTILRFCLDLLRAFNPFCCGIPRGIQPIYFELNRYPEDFQKEIDDSKSRTDNLECLLNIEQRLFREREQREQRELK